MEDALEQMLRKGMEEDGPARLFGIKLLEVGKERITAEFTVTPALARTGGVAFGGAFMSVADMLGGVATMANLPRGDLTTTIESKTNFFAPALLGERVIAACEPLHRGRKTMVWRTTVTNEAGRVLAVVTQTQIVLPRKRTPEETMTELFAGKSAAEHKELLAKLERSGAALYRVLARRTGHPRARRLAAADAKEENARLLEGE